MRFVGERAVTAHKETVWEGLHDPGVLRAAIPGCDELRPTGGDEYAARLAVHVGPVADVYRGTFSVLDVRSGSELRVVVRARGRFGRLDLELSVRLEHHSDGITTLVYDATARVTGLVARVGRPTMTVVGTHLTACFFRDLDRAVRPVSGPVLAVPAQPQVQELLEAR